MTGDTGDQVVHIGENAEIVSRPQPAFAGLLDVDEPIETEDSPATTLSALRAATDLMHGGNWRPAIVDAHVPETGEAERVLAFVNDDDASEVILVVPADTPEKIQETTT